MKKTIYAFFVLTALSITSCFDHEFKQESIHKEGILKYLKNLRSIDPDQVQQIDELESKLDFRDVEVYNLKTTERLIIAHVKSLEAFKDADDIRAIFYINQNEIVRSNIVTFHDAATPSNYDDVIISMVDRREKTYSGKISFHSAFQSLFLFSELENGKLTVNGVALPKVKDSDGGRTEACTDWYLVTTTYYASGATRRTEQYLYTTCDCESNETRMGRAACGGGGATASNGPTLSPNATHGSEVEWSDRNGKYILYRYNAYISTWQIVLITLPVVEFATDPYTYPDLAAIHYPIHGQVIYGDNTIFTYDANSGKWFGVLCITNQLKSPCLKKVGDKVLDPATASAFNQLIQDVFNQSEEVNWTIGEGPVSKGSADTDMIDDSMMNIITLLDTPELTGFSQEFIASIMYHEAFHAIMLHYGGDNFSPNQHHRLLMTTFLGYIATALRASYPNISMIEAKGLILKDVFAQNPYVRNQILTEMGMTAQQVNDINVKFMTNKTGSTPCN